MIWVISSLTKYVYTILQLLGTLDCTDKDSTEDNSVESCGFSKG